MTVSVCSSLFALDCNLEVRLDNMCVKMDVEQMLSWMKKKGSAVRSGHLSV